uniref:NUC173 domain-containing protein n=1 Tax=Globodera pallida TaxID=36090 RepID=A0A183C035_GLOPA
MTPPFGASLESSIKSALPFLSTHGDGAEPLGAPDPILTKLIHESASLASTARLEPCSSSLAELLHRCALLLSSPTTRPLLRSKILLLLSNFFLYNVSLRKSAANSEQICLAVFHCLRAAFDDHLGPQNVIDVLRIIQMLTYERVNFGDWIFELLPFLTREILNAVPSELLPYCMCILCNLVSQSKPFTNRFKQMDSFKCFCSRILQLLSHNSKALPSSSVRWSLSAIWTRKRGTLSQNISQTFLCIFNILSSAAPDVLMTTHIAVDLLRRLVINQPKSPNDIPMLNATARDLTSYEFFEKSIQKVAGLLNLLDPRSEESRKIVQLFLAFCQLDELRGPTSVAIVAVEPNELKLNTPAHALVNMARLDFEEAIFPEVPLTALQLLAFVVKESVEAGKGIRRIFSSFDPLCALLKQVTRTVKIEPNSPLAPFHAKLIAEGLRLAESLANDEDFRRVLLDIVHAQLCADIFGEQLSSNPIVHHWLLVDLLAPSFQIYNYEVSQPSLNSSSSSKGPSLPLWSINAIAIPIQLMRLLASLKDHSKPHKELYWRSLKDHRLLPFMAYAIARGTSALVYDAFVLFTHCAQVHDFPLKRLSILTAKCAALKNASRGGASADGQQASSSKNVSFSSSFEQQQQQLPLSAEYTNGGFPNKGGRAEVSEMVKLVETLQYELQAKEKKERELEKKLSEHSPAGGGGGTTGGINGTGTGGAMPSADQNNNLRRFVNELERRVVEADAEIAALSSEKGELLRRVERLQKALDTERAQHASALGSAERDRQMLVEENERERALHAVMRDKFDEMRRKFDTAAKTVFDKQSELDKAVEADTELNKRFHEQENELATRRMELEGATKMLSALNGQVADREMRLNRSENELQKFREHNNKLSLLSQQMAQLLEEFEAAK